ncbi:MAG: 23S rRNA (adenine(2503)-C(2))-methyltransferase RlmN, partial [Christensenellaceae bacterium]|nr:23S rRNA (adenine(2503)-C(2))-methyltransferase RlmN [Christensenellaceae bacterium]
MKYLYDLSFDELKEWCLSQGEPKFRAGQIFAALHNGTSLADIIGVPNALKEKISAEFETRLPSPEIIQKSKDGTVKYLLKLNDGKKIECVLLKQDYGNTLCVSSQVGCRMACAFCASGKNGLVRNLTCGEILAEVILINKLNMAEARDQHETDGSKKKGTIRAITNIVIMGSGEPFDNYDETI